MGEFYQRNDKVAFIGVTSGNSTTYHRMTDYTELSLSKNAREYTRRYVDEANDRSNVTGYAPSLSYKFDREDGNTAQEPIIDITDNELLGSAAVIKIIIVDFNDEGTTTGTYKAVSRDFSVIPNTEGDTTDAYTYSGTLRACGAKTFGTVTSTDSFATCSFTANS